MADKSLKILMVTPYFAPAWGYGGPPRINYDLANFLVRAGHEVTVLSTDALSGTERVLPADEAMGGITVKRFKNISNRLAWNLKIFLPLGFGRYLKRHLPEYDFVFLSDFRDWQNVLTYRECLKRKIPYSVAAYGELPLTGGLKSIVKKVYDRCWGRQMLAGAKYLFGQTSHENSEYLKYGGKEDQCKLLPLGINYQDFLDLPAENGFRAKHGISVSDRVILFIGRLNVLKGIDILVRVLPKVIGEVPEARLVIIGRDDGYLKTLKQLIYESKFSDRITLIGPMYGRDNYAAYLSSDVFAFTPKHFEETSLASLAALALGRPVVVTEQASIPYLKEYNAGFEVKNDVQMVADKLTVILEDSKLGEVLGQNGQRLIREVFDLPKVGDLLEEHIYAAVNDTK